MVPSSAERCRRCGAVLLAGGPSGLCAKCLLTLGLQVQAEAGENRDEERGEKAEEPANERSPRSEAAAVGGGSGLKAAPDGASLSEKAGDKIGRYRLLEQIGEGGFGVVYKAEQKEPVRRQVALKIIKLGMDTRQVVARFETERHALELMDHPNIAKILDAGATETGRPYFVMELVEGIKITDYCNQNHLSTRQRLELFIQICHAVQHAHQKGVIHRDIKPSNILVTSREGYAVPKIIDFGIAKATQAELTEQTVFTQFGHFLGTPAYMSPEQVDLGRMDIDTRTDIYSLGVLLYELLTGQAPFETKELLAQGLDELRRIIREKEPPTPSTRLNQALLASRSSRSDKSALRTPDSALDKDLDWITMKALEKDRQRRYETVNGLARDIERYLKNEPVAARPPSRGYRFQKLIRRNKLLFGAAALVFMVLALGIVVSTWQAIRARRAEGEARTEAVKSQQIAALLEKMLQQVGPSVALGRDTTLLREMLDRTADQVTTELKDQPLVAAELQQEIGDAYIGILNFARAERLHRRALETRRKLLGPDNPDIGRSLLRLAVTRRCQEKFSEAEALDREALAMYRRLSHPDLADALFDLAVVLEYDGRFNEAEAPVQEALSLFRKTPGDHRLKMADALAHLGSIRNRQGKLPEAEKLLLEQLPIIREFDGSQDLFFFLGTLGDLLLDENKLSQAEDAFRERLAIARHIYYDTHPGYLAQALSSLSGALGQEGKFDEAEAHLQEGLAILRKGPADHRSNAAETLGHQRLEMANGLGHLANIRRQQGRTAEAENILKERLTILREAGASKDLLFAICDFADLQSEQGKRAQAHDALSEGLAIVKRAPQDITPRDLAGAVNRLSIQLVGDGKFEEAEHLEQELLSILQKNPGDQRLEIAKARFRIGRIRSAQGRKAEAEKLIREQLPTLRELATPEELLWPLGDLANVLKDQGKSSQAEDTAREALTIARSVDRGPNHLQLATALSNLSGTLLLEGKLDEAETLQQETLDALRKTPGDQRLEIAKGLRQLADIRRGQGRKGEAEKLMLEQLPVFRELGTPGDLFWYLCQAGYLLADTGKGAEAEDAFREAVALARQLDLNTNAGHVPNALSNLAAFLAGEGKFNEAEALEREAVELLRKGPADQGSVLAKGLSSLSGVLQREGKFNDAEALLQEALSALGKAPGDHRLETAKMLQEMANIRRAQGQKAEAEKLMLQQLPILRELGTPEDLAASLGALGWLFLEEGRTSSAEQMFRELIPIERRICGAKLNFLINPLLALANCLFSEGRAPESQTYVCEAVSIQRTLTANQRAAFGMSGWLGQSLEVRGDLAEAEYWYRQALLEETIHPRQPPDQYAQTVINLVVIHFPQNKFHELEAVYPEWLQNARARLPADDPALADILAQVISAPLAENKFEEAEPLARECWIIRENKLPNDWRTHEARSTLGCCLLRQKKYTEAEPLLVSGCEGLRQHIAEIPEGWRPRASADLACLAQLYEATGRSELAREWSKKCQEFDQPAAPQRAVRTDVPAASKQ